ncbi:hypothetical protein AG1IA_09472 [Rhizoctonia solani AG-1 IA]|uniref:Uncharacterized protein n=1 Tax=Thanatephorus cucumeris (strain AG1-IA) TaxID=983506 RepID=L8WE94_THACA|nr:hypothetical protein AG1IA_09472 [Rhizoctonia solani AG-1 IA]
MGLRMDRTTPHKGTHSSRGRGPSCAGEGWGIEGFEGMRGCGLSQLVFPPSDRPHSCPQDPSGLGATRHVCGSAACQVGDSDGGMAIWVDHQAVPEAHFTCKEDNEADASEPGAPVPACCVSRIRSHLRLRPVCVIGSRRSAISANCTAVQKVSLSWRLGILL